MVRCCDYYQNGSGYEFSVCYGIGAIIREDLINAERDLFYAQQPYNMNELNFLWQDFSYLVDNFCEARQQ